MRTDDGMVEAAVPFGMAVSGLNSLDRDGLMNGWPGLRDPILGQGTRITIELARQVALARVRYLEADSRKGQRRARRELKTAAYKATRFVGEASVRPEPSAQLLTNVGVSIKTLADCLLVTEGLGTWPENDPYDFGIGCAEHAIKVAKELDAWPLEAVAKDTIYMLKAARGDAEI